MIFETNRLLVRELTLFDAKALQPIFSDPEVMRFSVRGLLSDSEIIQHIHTNIAKYGKSHFCRWAVVEKHSKTLIGVCGISKDSAESREIIHLNYRLATPYWGQGFATELVTALAKYCNDIGVSPLYALIEPANTASIRVVSKSGFTAQGGLLYKGVNALVFKWVNQ